MAKENESIKYDKTTEIIDKLFPKGDKRRGDAMVVAGISHIEGREEMREIIINTFGRKAKEGK